MAASRGKFALVVCLLSAGAVSHAGGGSGAASPPSPHVLPGGERAGEAGSDPVSCSLCHVSSGASSDKPRWSSRSDPFYGLYGSDGAEDTGTKPEAHTAVCLSCHDGTIPGGSEFEPAGPPGPSGGSTGFFALASGHQSLPGPAEHPVSVRYASEDVQNFNPAVDGSVGPLPLFGPGRDRVECTTCHNPHGSPYPALLRMPNNRSAMCLTCHRK
ncbi:MAG: hypothetical protein D6806_18960 [Deltaproteobacteria bacterium]|nr:MAG: hypothetical protein D6806_18960 [Deltaproteobacteria bacterium]